MSSADGPPRYGDAALRARALVNARPDPALPSLCFADAADNPGGGGRGNTPYILKGFLEAGCRAAVVAPVFDPALAAEAHERGAGASFRARFNRAESTLYSDPFDWGCRVEAYASSSAPPIFSLIRLFSFADTRNTTTRRGSIGTGSPVFGLRPMRRVWVWYGKRKLLK